jgi:hypothetical protein
MSWVYTVEAVVSWVCIAYTIGDLWDRFGARRRARKAQR